MTYLGDLGQAGAIIGAITSVTQTAANVAIQKHQIKTERRLTEKELQHAATMAVMGQEFRDKELASKIEVSKRRDTLFRDLALYVGLGLGAIVILTSIGTILIKGKRL